MRGRRPSMRTTAIGEPRFAARSLGMLLRQTPRERGRLTVGAAPRHLQFLFQPLVFAAQPIALDFGAPHVLAEPIDLSRLQLLDDLAADHPAAANPWSAEAHLGYARFPGAVQEGTADQQAADPLNK